MSVFLLLLLDCAFVWWPSIRFTCCRHFDVHVFAWNVLVYCCSCRLRGKPRKLSSTICTRLHSSTLLLVEQFLDPPRILRLSPRSISRTIYRHTTRLPGRYWRILIFYFVLVLNVWIDLWSTSCSCSITSNFEVLIIRVFFCFLELLFQVIVASGAVKHEDIVGAVKSSFTKLLSDPTTAAQLVAKEPATFTGSEVGNDPICSHIVLWFSFAKPYFCFIAVKKQVRIIDDDVPLAQFAVAFSGASWTDPDSIPLMVMQAMLGSYNKNSGGAKHMGWGFCCLLCLVNCL